jgi:hypothetical protein
MDDILSWARTATYMVELLNIDNCMVQSAGGDVRNLAAIRKMNGDGRL